MATEPLSRSGPTPEPTEAEYRAFCDTVMATGRGRWFLAEYARRHRRASADDALDALARLENRLHGGRAAGTAHIFEELHSLAATIRHARLDIGWSDSEFSKGAKVMALLELLEERIASLLDDSAETAVAATIEERSETRVQLTVISDNSASLRARAELPPIDFAADATIVALPQPVPVASVAPVAPQPVPEIREVAVAAEPPASTLAFTTVELFQPFEAERPGDERLSVAAAIDFAPAEPVETAGIVAAETVAAMAPVVEPTMEEPVAAVPQRPPGYDPLTPVRALSADERIALVS